MGSDIQGHTVTIHHSSHYYPDLLRTETAAGRSDETATVTAVCLARLPARKDFFTKGYIRGS